MSIKGGRLALAGAAMIALAAALDSPAISQTQQQIDWCVNRNHVFSPDQAINGCTAAIQSGRWSGKGAAWAIGNRCIAYKDRGDYDRAIADCDQAIRLDPTNAINVNARAAAYYLKHDYDRAIADYSEAMRLNPQLVDPVHNRGMAYGHKGDFAHAIADYDHALRIDARDAVALYNRGLTKRKMGDTAGGDADIAAAKTINPSIGN